MYLDYLIYAKIIIDDIQLPDGQVANSVLGGGAPQAAFGAGLWSDSVGLLTRSGTDIEPEFVARLESLNVDLQGWARFPDLQTMRGNPVAYDQNERMVDDAGQHAQIIFDRENWLRLLSRPLELPPHYRRPRAIHLVTEYHDEPMVHTALGLRQKGAILSLEPLIDLREWSNREQMLSLIGKVDVVTPDWPSASAIAGSENAKDVVRYWSRLGPGLVAVRQGANGSYVWQRERNEVVHIPALRVDAVDPTGAGNGYGGGLLVGWDRERDARLAGAYGTVSASFVVEQVGAPAVSESVQQDAQQRLQQLLPQAQRLS